MLFVSIKDVQCVIVIWRHEFKSLYLWRIKYFFFILISIWKFAKRYSYYIKIKHLTILGFTDTVVFYIFLLIDAQDAQSNILFFDAIKSNISRIEFIINSCQPVAQAVLLTWIRIRQHASLIKFGKEMQ